MKPYKINPIWHDQIPAHSAQVLEEYVNHGGTLSTFYTRLLSGDAYGAASSADPENLAAMGFLLALIGQDFPSASYGSREAVTNWPGLMTPNPLSVPTSWTEALQEMKDEGATIPPRPARRELN